MTLSPTTEKVRKKYKINTISLFGHIGLDLGPELLTQES